MLLLGADCSTSYSNPPSQQQARLWSELGLKLMVVGTSWTPGIHVNEWEKYVPVQEYQFPEKLHSTTRPWWVDAETPTATQPSISHAMNKGAIGVYTRRGWWLDNLPDWNIKQQYPSAMLWDARYTHGDGPCRIVDALNTGNIDAVRAAIAIERDATPPFKPYAGFDKADMTQWHNSITIFGINVDLNFFEDDVEDSNMTPFLFWDVKRGRAYLMTGAGTLVWVTDARDLELYERFHGKMTLAVE